MRVIVSSRYAVEVVDFHTGDIHLIKTAPFESLYYGITWNGCNMFISRRDLEINKSCIEVLDLELEYIESAFYGKLDIDDVHQICWYDNMLWMAVSGRNSIATYSHDVLSSFYPDADVVDVDKNHFNSIWFDRGYVYIVAHNRGDSYVWQFAYPSFDSVMIGGPIGVGAHNVIALCEKLYTLDSGRGQLASMNGNVALYRNNYPRGVALYEDYLFVGRSEHITDRKQRDIERRGAVQCYKILCDAKHDKLRLKHLDTIELHHGHVHEVRLLNLPDKAHNSMMWRGKWGI